MKKKFILSVGFGVLWPTLSIWLSIPWIQSAAEFLPPAYVWAVVTGVAFLPGYLMSAMFFSNLLHRRVREYPKTDENTTVILCAHNEEESIAGIIQALLCQNYGGRICILAVDNASTDGTKARIQAMARLAPQNRQVRYLYCGQPGKANALNLGLSRVRTRHFLTVDADTWLEKNAVQRIMNHVTAARRGCVAGNLFVQNPTASLTARMQNYDYLLSIAAVKRFQGSYGSTLVAQGAFSAYNTCAVRRAGGWRQVMGEDIVLTYRLLELGYSSGYEPAAVGYTRVPESIGALYRQRRRWAMGMLEGLREVPPWRQRGCTRYFTSVNLSIIYLDLAYLFGLVPGVILALLGYPWLVGLLTVFTAFVGALCFFSVYRYQQRLNIPFRDTVGGFVLFLFFFQLVQSTASLHGYLSHLTGRTQSWK